MHPIHTAPEIGPLLSEADMTNWITITRTSIRTWVGIVPYLSVAVGPPQPLAPALFLGDHLSMAAHKSAPSSWGGGRVAFAPQLPLGKMMDLPAADGTRGRKKKKKAVILWLKCQTDLDIARHKKSFLFFFLSAALACSIIEVGCVNQGHSQLFIMYPTQ